VLSAGTNFGVEPCDRRPLTRGGGVICTTLAFHPRGSAGSTFPVCRRPRRRIWRVTLQALQAVQIEPGLRPESPKNGSFFNVRRRLSAISLSERPKPEPKDRRRIRKSPPLAGLSMNIRGNFSKRRTAWLATQCCSHPSPRKFPANREFYREFRIFEVPGADFVAINCCAAATSREIPYAD
jgi:hypothetical protein